LGAAADQAGTIQSSRGSKADIGTQTAAEDAVTALANAVSLLGVAQAAVGKGENNLNYAVALATSQNTSQAAAESEIRDANLAAEAANLSRAQILVQAGTAALAQANSAPQAILQLLK
jgi:flagellin